MIDDPTSASSSTSPDGLRGSASTDGLRRHEKYFLKDDYTLLQVEDKLFRISSRWLDINTPRLADLRRQSAATSPEQPVPIPDVRAAELETLLYFIEESMKDGFGMHTDRWIELLSIAHKLQLHAIKPRAIAEIFKGASPPDPIRQFVLYEAYDVPRSNLTRAMHDLIVRPYALFEAEMAQLSHRTIAEIGGLREDYIRERLRPLGRWPGNAERVARALVACWAASGSGARFRKGGRAML